jgi:hypothetical protein
MNNQEIQRLCYTAKQIIRVKKFGLLHIHLFMLMTPGYYIWLQTAMGSIQVLALHSNSFNFPVLQLYQTLLSSGA